ncbi:sodium/hydrogen exchanger [Striga asiatica]|uniref:Sodium/hydrogen exchanger n=1 Tax=Striga asiatica TaxID=4170 RepID=A0A5A7PXL0_STRAF|nr:sodium/hydrogen exchanger [Striga asiatica]
MPSQYLRHMVERSLEFDPIELNILRHVLFETVLMFVFCFVFSLFGTNKDCDLIDIVPLVRFPTSVGISSQYDSRCRRDDKMPQTNNVMQPSTIGFNRSTTDLNNWTCTNRDGAVGCGFRGGDRGGHGGSHVEAPRQRSPPPLNGNDIGNSTGSSNSFTDRPPWLGDDNNVDEENLGAARFFEQRDQYRPNGFVGRWLREQQRTTTIFGDTAAIFGDTQGPDIVGDGRWESVFCVDESFYDGPPVFDEGLEELLIGDTGSFYNSGRISVVEPLELVEEEDYVASDANLHKNPSKQGQVYDVKQQKSEGSVSSTNLMGLGTRVILLLASKGGNSRILNCKRIMLFGAVGTIISFSIISFGAKMLFETLDMGYLKVQDYLAIGAIFSSTDSVCTLEVLHPDLLYSLVFGEGLVNDAIFVVLFNAIPNFGPFTLTNILVASANASLFELGRQIHARTLRLGHRQDKCGALECDDIELWRARETSGDDCHGYDSGVGTFGPTSRAKPSEPGEDDADI